jgi:L-rhamnose isomerase/sugar isomerase
MRDPTAVKDALKNHQIELPSRAFGNSGTRFKAFGQPGVPRNAFEKAEDAAQVHKYTGVAPRMAVHIPWDRVDDYAALAAYAKDLGIGIGTVNGNVFQDDDYKLGSVCNPDPKVRSKALAHLLECVDIMDVTGSRDLKLWFADGLVHCQALGPKALVVVDTGHHAQAVNIEFIVVMLLRIGKLGGFDFTSRFYADDDLMVGAADPFQLFRIMAEVVRRGARAVSRGGVHARPVRQGTAHRHRRTGGGATGRGRSGRQRRADGRV